MNHFADDRPNSGRVRQTTISEPGSLAEVVDQVEQRRLGPVHVVEDQQRRRKRFEQSSDRPVRLAQRNGVLRRRVRRAG